MQTTIEQPKRRDFPEFFRDYLMSQGIFQEFRELRKFKVSDFRGGRALSTEAVDLIADISDRYESGG
jgi:hypothetical protein